jgi:hypothetical protein
MCTRITSKAKFYIYLIQKGTYDIDFCDEQYHGNLLKTIYIQSFDIVSNFIIDGSYTLSKKVNWGEEAQAGKVMPLEQLRLVKVIPISNFISFLEFESRTPFCLYFVFKIYSRKQI